MIAAKYVNKANKVACGATSPRGNNQPGTVRPSTSPLAFLRAMKNAGARGFDAYAHHPYSGSRQETPLTPPPAAKRGAPPTAVTMGNITLSPVNLPLPTLTARLWISEYGYQTNPPDKMVGVTAAQQAKYMQQAWNTIKAIPRVRRLRLVPPARRSSPRWLAIRAQHLRWQAKARKQDLHGTQIDDSASGGPTT